MKIGIFTDTYYPEINGVATSCFNLYRELQKRGHEVHVYAPKCKNCKNYDYPNIHYISSVPFAQLKDRNLALLDIAAIHEAVKENFDIVHTNSEFVLGGIGAFVSQQAGCPRVHTYHTLWEDYTYYITHGFADDLAKDIVKRYSSWWCKKQDRIITPTGKTKTILESYGVTTPIDIIPSGMELDRFSPDRHSAEEKQETRKECGVKENERVLINIGRLAKEKNALQIMRVFPKLLEIYPDIRFVIVGEGPQKEELGTLAQELGVLDHVSLTGPKPWEKIDRYYAIGDVFASASQSETQGLTYIEAMASGLIVTAVNDPCLEGVIEDGVSGFLTEPTDESLLDGLIRAFSPENLNIREAALEAAVPYSTARFAESVEACYCRALTK